MTNQEKGRKMDFDDERDLLIQEIEQHPAIWNMKHSDYRNTLARRKCWEQITESFSPAKKSKAQTEALIAHLQNRWKNTRDHFTRTTRFGGNTTSRKGYFSKLKFLTNSAASRKHNRPTKRVALKAKRAPSTSSKALDASERPRREKRTRIHNGLEAPMSQNTPSDSLDIPDLPENELIPSPEKSTTDNSSETPMSQNTASGSLDVPEEQPRSPPEKSTIDNSSQAPMSKNPQSASLGIPDVPKEESRPSALSDILNASGQESKGKRTRTDSSLVETKLIEFLERNMAELQDLTKNNQDEDRLFLLSLLTSLKSVQPPYKLKAKIEILSVLDKYLQVYEESNVEIQPQIIEVMHSVDQ